MRGRGRFGQYLLVMPLILGAWDFAFRAASAEEMDAKPGQVQIGDASWYGAYHQGRKTASGEPFDPKGLTAAHPTLPLDSTVRVTNLKNGKTVDVRVNDRGPYKRRRVIDLSAKAAEKIDLKRRGVSTVRVEPLAGGGAQSTVAQNSGR
jgi:rare lipoprotein A